LSEGGRLDMKKGLIATFMVALMLITVFSAVVGVNAISIKEETVSTNTEPAEYSKSACLFGRIENLYEDEYQKTFNAVNLRIVSLFPLGFYHLKSGERVYIEPNNTPPIMFIIYGILTDNFIFVLCKNVGW
jgi:hypothetical protein